MLKTLEKYIDDPAVERRSPFILRSSYGRDRRFPKLLVLSVLCHFIFYAAIIRLDQWSIQQQLDRRSEQVRLVKLTDVAPPPERPSRLRSLPQRIERVDLSRLRFDPDRADDENLIERSPTLGSPNAVAKTETVPRERSAPASRAVEPPTIPRETPSPAPSIPALVVARVEPPPPPRAKAASSLSQTAPPAPAPGDETAEHPTRGEEASGTRDLGLQAIQSQFLAYVRKRIRDTNERIMPRDWIRDMLKDKVSADFEVKLGRGGQIVSARLLRSSGYSVLDDSGRQAIYTARPFDGFPPTAGDLLTLTVTVYYSPTW